MKSTKPRQTKPRRREEGNCPRCLGTGEGLPGESKDGYCGHCKQCGGTGDLPAKAGGADARNAALDKKAGQAVREQRLARLRKVVGCVLQAVRDSKDGWVMHDDDANGDFHVAVTLAVREVRELKVAMRWLAQPSAKSSD